MIGCNAVHAFLLTFFLLLLTTTKSYGKRYALSHQNLRLPGRAVYDGICAKSLYTKHSGCGHQGALRNASVSDPKFSRFRHPDIKANVNRQYRTSPSLQYGTRPMMAKTTS